MLLDDWYVLIDYGRKLMTWLRRERNEAIYEVLEYDSTLELVDSKGEWATFKRLQKVRFLQNNVIAIQDHVMGDGDVVDDYRCSPGIVADCYPEGDHWNILISLRETKSRGDVEDIYIERRVRSGFTKSEEWRQMEVWTPIKDMRLSIIFPKDRHCKRAMVKRRKANKTIPLGQEYFHILPDGRQKLIWEKKNPRLAEVYTFQWIW